jgi:hypothetical protein
MARKLWWVSTVLLGAMLIAGLGVPPTYADTGGGCASVPNNQVCISVWSGTTNPLRSDYYLFSFTRGEYRAEVSLVHNYSPGTCSAFNGLSVIPKGTDVPVTVGHSPVYTTIKPAGSNCAKTHVIFYNNLGSWIYDNYSPWQRW